MVVLFLIEIPIDNILSFKSIYYLMMLEGVKNGKKQQQTQNMSKSVFK